MSKEAGKEGDFIPELIRDPCSGTVYKKGGFFGKGGFAKCYELTDTKSGNTFAGKVVPKRLLVKGNQKEKMTSEIKIHQSIKHANIVGFYNFFDDPSNVYIILELCRKRSMMELHRRRKAITEPEARFFMKQILDGVGYLHQHNIIHRDLKLGNLFLDDNLRVKIGDFGLAAKLDYDGERKKTLCGTPNYIAPEILNKNGHSFEVDMWSIGCILYTLLVGKPPFETNTLKETYSRIKKCEYTIPNHIPRVAASLITQLLQPDPKKRPTVAQALKHEWFNIGVTPTSLPASVLVSAPRLHSFIETKQQQPPAGLLGRKPLTEINNGGSSPSSGVKMNSRQSLAVAGGANVAMVTQYQCKKHLQSLCRQLSKLLSTNLVRDTISVDRDEDTDPAAQPLVWVAKWVDYTDKYGFGFQLIDGTYGVMFNDTTKIVILPNKRNIHYIHRDGQEDYFTVEEHPAELEKKIKLLTYFKRYMNQHLTTAGSNVVREQDTVSRTPYLYQWFRTSKGVFMCLTNGTVQINFLDHTKVILCPLMGAATYVDESKNFRTYRFTSLEEKGCSQTFADSLKYIYEKLNYNLRTQ